MSSNNEIIVRDESGSAWKIMLAGRTTVAYGSGFDIYVSLHLGGSVTVIKLSTKDPIDPNQPGGTISVKDIVGYVAEQFGFQIPDFASSKNPLVRIWDTIYSAQFVPTLEVSPSASNRYIKGNLDLEDPLKIPIIEIELKGVYVSYAKKEFDFGINVTINGREQTLIYPFPTPPPETPAFKLNYLGVGQRVRIPDVDKMDHVAEVIARLREDLLDEGGGEVLTKLGQYYQPESQWLFGTSLEIRNLLDLQIVFNDPVFYGLAIGLSKKPLDGLKFEILYKKISEDVGLYYLDLTLPIQYRQIDLAQVSITLPSIAIWIYTNGDFKVSIGWPLGERSITVQVFPFIGGGGFYFGKLSSATAPDMPTDANYAPILVFGLALRLGVGKEFNKGILVASVSVTLYGIFEGRLAWIDRSETTVKRVPRVGARPTNGVPALRETARAEIGSIPDYFKFQATVGLVGLIQGAVDFSIIKATLTVRAEASASITFETRKDTEIVLNANVSIRLRVEIGGFKIFGKRVSITITLTFKADLTQRFVIKNDSTAAQLAAAVKPIAALPWGKRSTSAVKNGTIHLYFVPQVTVAGGVPQFIAGLTIPTEPAGGGKIEDSDFGKLVNAVSGWVIEGYSTVRGIEGDARRELFDYDDLEHLGDCLHAGGALNSRTRQASPLTYDAIIENLRNDFDDFVLAASPPDDSTTCAAPEQQAVFPIFAELTLAALGREAVNFRVKNPKDETYRQRLGDYYDELLVAFAGPDSAALLDVPETELPSMAMLLFEDYFGLIANAVQKAVQDRVLPPGALAGDARPRRISFAQALGEIDYNQIAGAASRFMQYGMRPPAGPIPAEKADWPGLELDAIYSMTGQQFPITLPPDPLPYVVALQVHESAAEWLKADANCPPTFVTDSGSRAAYTALAAIDVAPDFLSLTPQAPLAETPQQFVLKNITPWEDPKGVEPSPILSLSQPLTQEIAANGTLELGVYGKPPPTSGMRLPEALPYRRAVRIDLTLTRVTRHADGEVSREGEAMIFVPHTYQVGGAEEKNRKLLDELLKNSEQLGGIEDISLLYPVGGDKPGMASDSLDLNKVLLIKTNLSTESNPPMAGAENERDPVYARLTPEERDKFLRLLWECSIVNSGGFYLYYETEDGGDLPIDDLFDEGDSTPSSVLVTFPGGENTLYPFNNVIVMDPMSGEREESDNSITYYAYPTGRFDYDAAVPAGCVSFEVIRKNPNAQYTTPASLENTPHGSTGLTRRQVVETLEANGIGKDDARFDAMLAETEDLKIQVENLFNLLQFQINASGNEVQGFEQSIWSLPMGPGRDDQDPEALAAFEAAEEPDWTYAQSPAVYRFAKQNTELSRYGGVGSDLSVTLRVLDIFGNLIGPDENNAVLEFGKLLYHDRLLGIEEWPGSSIEYTAAKHDPGAQFTVEIAFDPSAVLPDGGNSPGFGDQAADALVVYNRVHDQLNDPNTQLEFGTTLAPGTTFAIDKGPLTAYVNEIRNFLESVSEGGSRFATEAPTVQCEFVITDEMLAAQEADIFPVDLWILFWRTRYVDEETTKKNPRAKQVLIEVPPHVPRQPTFDDADLAARAGVAGDDETSRLSAFAKQFEEAFSGLRVALGAATPTQRPRQLAGPAGEDGGRRWAASEQADDDVNIFAVRLGPEGIHITPDPKQRFYFAPKPLSTSLLSDDFVVREYKSDWNGDPCGGGPECDFTEISTTFSNVDLDVWALEFLGAFDSFLEPEMSLPVAQLNAAKYAELMGYKEDIAEAIRESLTPVLEDADCPPPSAAQLDQAKDVFYQRLLVTLSSAYQVNSVSQIPVQVTVPHYNPNSPYETKLYGNVSAPAPPPGTDRTGDGQPHATFSTSKVKLGPLGASAIGTETFDQVLTFLFSSADPIKKRSFQSDLLYHLSFIETEIPKAEDPAEKPGYLPSSWLKFVLTSDKGEPDTFFDVALGDFDIPIPLRQYPILPSLSEQSVAASYKPGGNVDEEPTLEELLQWNYSFSYRQQRVSQDEVWAQVEYNNIPQTKIRKALQGVTDEERPLPLCLFEALARFSAEYSAIASHFDAVVEAAESGGDEKIAQAVIRRFTELVKGVALLWSQPLCKTEQADADVPEPVINVYRITEHDQQEEIVVRRYQRKEAGGWPEWPKIAGFRQCEEPGPALSDRVGEYQEATYCKTSDPDGDCLPDATSDEDDALRHRKLCFTGENNVLSRQNGIARIRLVRNMDLVPNCETNPDFIYGTPNISFPNTLTPYLEYAKPFSIDDNIRFPGTDLATKLAGFFKKLFASEGAANRAGAPHAGGGGAIPHLIKLEATYQYPLAATAGEALNTRLPLRLIDGYSFNAEDATLGDGTFVSELARSLATWYRGSRPATDQAKLSFDLTVFVNFDTKSRKLPLFRLMQVQLSVESSDSWWGPAAPVEE